MISVVVPAYNAAATLPACIAALRKQTCVPDEIIVVDDGSTDDTVAVAEAAGACVVRQVHRGPAAARNLGVSKAYGSLVLFTDADCEPLPDWVERITVPFADPRVMGVKGTYRSRQREPMARLIQIEFEDKYARMRLQETIDFIDTYSAAYRREVFLKAGGFNEVFPLASVEDVELSFRLAEQGARLMFAPQAQVWHIHSTSLWHYLRRKARYGFWRALVYRWHPKKIRGDSHTDPILKIQFALVGLIGLSGLVAFVTQWTLLVALLASAVLVATTLPFAWRVWPRDRLAALMVPTIHTLRAFVQTGALTWGLLVHSLGTSHRQRATATDVATLPDPSPDNNEPSDFLGERANIPVQQNPVTEK
ncbi:MAG: glycosyltransferase [Chloroflexi bacterium]|nr:glycosyltransferase [Chloroflexota bacterium]